MPLAYGELAKHCAFCAAAANLIYQECGMREHGALTILMLTHQQNDQEREDFYARYLSFLYGSPRAFTTTD
jgi:hypothetical protein